MKKTANSRKFMYYTFIPYIFMLAYLIPVGNSNIYGVLHAYSYDGNLVSEGICFLIDAVLLLFASFKLKKNEKGSQLSLPAVLVVGCAAFSLFPFRVFRFVLSLFQSLRFSAQIRKSLSGILFRSPFPSFWCAVLSKLQPVFLM